MRDGFAPFVVEINGIHELAVNVELELIPCTVSNADGMGAPVAAKVEQRFFGQIPASVDAVHYLQRSVRAEFAATLFDPVVECFCFLRVAEPHEGVDGERS